MVEITLVAGKAFDKKDETGKGQDVSGFMYGGYIRNGKYVLFFTKVNHDDEINVSTKKFDPENNIEIDLESRIDLFTGKEKWRERDQA